MENDCLWDLLLSLDAYTGLVSAGSLSDAEPCRLPAGVSSDTPGALIGAQLALPRFSPCASPAPQHLAQRMPPLSGCLQWQHHSPTSIMTSRITCTAFSASLRLGRVSTVALPDMICTRFMMTAPLVGIGTTDQVADSEWHLVEHLVAAYYCANQVPPDSLPGQHHTATACHIRQGGAEVHDACSSERLTVHAWGQPSWRLDAEA